MPIPVMPSHRTSPRHCTACVTLLKDDAAVRQQEGASPHDQSFKRATNVRVSGSMNVSHFLGLDLPLELW